MNYSTGRLACLVVLIIGGGVAATAVEMYWRIPRGWGPALLYGLGMVVGAILLAVEHPSRSGAIRGGK